MELYPLNLERHSNRTWNSVSDFSWSRQEQLIPVALQEATSLMMVFPLAFLLHNSEYQFLALLGLRPNENVWVGLDGRWLAPRIPSLLQHYPFHVLHGSGGQRTLGVNESGLLPEGAIGGSPLYADHKPVPELSKILEQLTQWDLERQQSREIARVLARHELLEPWELQIQGEGTVHKVDGLYRVNEKRLNETSAEALVELRNSRALLMAYCQLLSMQQVQNVARMGEAQAKAREHASQTKSAVGNPGNEHGIISFNNL
jgi:hypothetical protein